MVRAILEEGIRAHDQGDAVTAASCYRRVLEQRPGNSDAIYLLGVIAYQDGRLEEAGRSIRQAIRIRPRIPYYYYYLGLVEKENGNGEKAVACWRKGLKLNKHLAPFYEELSKFYLDEEDPEQAMNWARRGLREFPDNLKLKNMKGIAHFNLGHYEEAETLYQAILQEQWESPEVWNNLGNCYYTEERWDKAVEAYRQALQFEPEFAEAWSNLGDSLRRQNRLEEALSALDRAKDIDPDYPLAWLNRGTILQIRGQMREAERVYERALALSPRNNSLFSNYLFSLMYRDDVDPAALVERHLEYGRRFTAEQPMRTTPARSRETERPLRIGLVSADFKWHAVSYFLEGFLKHYDREVLEVTAYSMVRREDTRTEAIRGWVDRWVPAHGLSDLALAETIVKQKIDILVDLSGHTEQNRLPVFGMRPAPVQVSWLGYPGTTGMAAIDYRLTDALTEPPALARQSAEALYTLPDGFHCYSPHPASPEPREAPCRKNGFVTFGSFNYLAKTTEGVIAAWSRLLERVPDSRLFLKSHVLEDPTVRARCEAAFREQGIAPERISFNGFRGRVEEHLEAYGELDIALDPFPYNGTTTTCEALWMGVPVVTLTGDRHAARVGTSLVTQAGHPEWAAADLEQYLDIAAGLAADPDGLSRLRRNLRAEMQASPLRDEAGFARKLEAAFREMWAIHLGNSRKSA